MSDPAAILQQARANMAKARLIAQYRDGRRIDAFRAAKQSDPALAAAFATDTAEELRDALRPAKQARRAALLLQAAELLRAGPSSKSKENTEAIAWLLAEAALAEERARHLRLGTLIVLSLGFLGTLFLLALS